MGRVIPKNSGIQLLRCRLFNQYARKRAGEPNGIVPQYGAVRTGMVR